MGIASTYRSAYALADSTRKVLRGAGESGEERREPEDEADMNEKRGHALPLPQLQSRARVEEQQYVPYAGAHALDHGKLYVPEDARDHE